MRVHGYAMKLCILYSSYEGSETPFGNLDTEHHLEAHFAGFTWEKTGLKKATAVRRITELAKKGYDVFINLCDGAWDEDRAGIEVVQALERLGLPFTGASSAFYEPSREMMKRVCHYYSIDTPGYVFADGESGIEEAASALAFPMIVKHPNSYSSVGMTKKSRVDRVDDLAAQVRLMTGLYGGALVEEFIEGREFTVLVAENAGDPENPHAYEPVEFIFPRGETFKHFDLKWVDYGSMQCRPCDDESIAPRLREISARFFTGLNGTGYGRCDIRVDRAGRAYMLEINPNCAVFGPLSDPGSADYVLMHDPSGHRGFIDRIVRAAAARKGKSAVSWRLKRDRNGQYGLFAVRNIEAGEKVEIFEERPHVLVSRSHVENRWSGRMKSWFGAYVYPLTDEIWVMWSPDPMEWKPLNHSCDPNCWLDGLDLAARRPIAAGEEITIDYATFCNEAMSDFPCSCGSPQCRGIIRGTDHLTDAVAPYGDHLSDYVKMKRNGRSL